MPSDMENHTAGCAMKRRRASPSPSPTSNDKAGNGNNRNFVQISRQDRVFRGRFESPHWKEFAVYLTACALIYPLLYGLTKAANGHTLFVVRLIVALGCSAIGIAVAYLLHGFVKRLMEAMTWRTILEQSESRLEGNRHLGITLAELTKVTTDPLSLFSISRLFLIRHRIWGSKHGGQMFFYVIVLFIIVVISVAGGLVFALGRIVDITTAWTFESYLYEEVPIFADLTDDPDAQSTADHFITLLQQPYLEVSMRDPNLPSWRFDEMTSSKMQMGNESVYFTTPYPAQMRTDGTAYGAAIYADNSKLQHGNIDVGSGDDSSTAKSLLYPQWGTTVVCDRLPDLASNIERAVVNTSVMAAGVTIPKDFTANLFGKLGLASPEAAIQTVQPLWFPSGSLDRRFPPYALPGNESTPNVLTTVVFEWDSKLNLTGNGQGTEDGRFIAGWLTNTGIDGGGWTIFDVFLIRCYAIYNQQTTQCSNFPLVDTDFSGGPFIGYDAIACVQRTDSYIVKVRNATKSVSITGIVGKGSNLESVISGKTKLRNEPLGGIVGRNLSSSTKGAQYFTNNVFSMWGWLSGSGNVGLLSVQDNSWFAINTSRISIPLFEDFLGVTAAKSVLPLMAGDKQLVARSYKSKQVAFAHILNVPMAIAIVLLFLAGVLGCFCVPKLPKGFPRRRFDLYSWIIAIHGDKMELEGGEGLINWQPEMDVEEVERKFGSMRVCHPIPLAPAEMIQDLTVSDGSGHLNNTNNCRL